MKNGVSKKNMSFRVPEQTWYLIRDRAKSCDTNMARYVELLVDRFAALSDQEFAEMVAKRDALRQRAREVLNEIGALETIVYAAEKDIFRMD